MASARLPSFLFPSPPTLPRRPSDHRRAPISHGGVNNNEENDQKDIVDASLTVLRSRMEDLKNKERQIPLPTRRGGVEFDNNNGRSRSYPSMSDAKLDRGKIVKNFALILECLELMSIVGGAFGLVLVGGSLF